MIPSDDFSAIARARCILSSISCCDIRSITIGETHKTCKGLSLKVFFFVEQIKLRNSTPNFFFVSKVSSFSERLPADPSPWL